MNRLWIISGCLMLLVACENSSFQGQTAGAGINDDSLRDRLESRGIVDSDTLKAACEKEASLAVVEASIKFPETRECLWEQGENLARRQGFVQAYGIDQQTVNMPEGSVICNLQLQSQPGISLHYDDFLFFMLEDYLLFGTNRNVTNYLEKDDGLYKWDFSKMRGQPIQNFEAPIYCLAGAERCQLPPHDRQGPVSIKLNIEETSQLAFKIADGRTSLNFRLAATGDNDNRDCYHTELNLDVKINYLKP